MHYRLTTRFELPLPRKEVFDFFAKAENLERITPDDLKFRILTPGPISINESTLIDYRLKLSGIPFRWQTLISRWEPSREFVDEQLRGPYHTWIHRHRFIESANGTIVEDEVRFRLPFHPFSSVLLPFIGRKLKHIFRYREKAIRKELLDENRVTGEPKIEKIT